MTTTTTTLLPARSTRGMTRWSHRTDVLPGQPGEAKYGVVD
jgi:hypothetical protein